MSAGPSVEEVNVGTIAGKVSMYDPINNVFREVELSNAKKFVAEAKRLEEIINQLEG